MGDDRRIVAPWTDREVEGLNAGQQSRMLAPIACPGGTAMVATHAGWVCPCCDHQQDWAWAMHLVLDGPTFYGSEDLT